MTPLEQEIRALVESEGPLPIASYMTLCLAHPTYGYYTTGQPIGGRAGPAGTSGDFITAPEVSQLFGELIGVWCMERWQALGSPAKFSLVECGPGRGTLMRDLLRIAGALPGFKDAADLFLVEVSPALAEQQSRLLSPLHDPIRWIGDIAGLPEQPTILIGNEFLDALPFRQWVKTDDRWVERGVGLANMKLAYATRPAVLSPSDLPAGHENQPDGTIFETAPAREAFVEDLARQIATNTGAALLIDYGHLQPGFGDTFQAVRDHGFVHPLEQPGRCDLTSHVDFAALARRAESAGCRVPPPVTQARFLLSLGLLERAGHLGSGRSIAVQDTLRHAVDRLAGAHQMGDLFKMLVFGTDEALGEPQTGHR